MVVLKTCVHFVECWGQKSPIWEMWSGILPKQQISNLQGVSKRWPCHGPNGNIMVFMQFSKKVGFWATTVVHQHSLEFVRVY